MTNYKISDERLNSSISNYLTKKYSNLDWSYKDEGDSINKCAKVFFKSDNFDDEGVFRLYYPCYWDLIGGIKDVNQRYEDSPILIFDDSQETDILNSYFGDYWKEVFIEWFNLVYGEKIKTLYL